MAASRPRPDAGAQAPELGPEQLRRHLDPASLPFATTAEVDSLTETVGQPRAVEALQFGLGIHTPGYNLFVTGTPGSGRVTAVLDHLRRWSAQRAVPSDWVYVNNFQNASQPAAIALPPGRGMEFAADMDSFIETVRRDLDRAFESDAYQQHRREQIAEINEHRQGLRRELDAFAAERGFALQATPFGVAVVPVKGDQPLSPEELDHLPGDRRAALERAGREIQEHLQVHAHQLRLLEKEATEKLADLDRSVVMAAVSPQVSGLREKYSEQEAVLAHLSALELDIPHHLTALRRREHPEDDGSAELIQELRPSDDGARYRVNVLVDNRALQAAPVVVERNPTYYNLFGRVEYQSKFGSLVTDFSHIRPGALHRANGGVLVLEAIDVLRNPFSWEALKRALRSAEVAVENLTEQLVLVPTPTLRPEPIPLDVKVVLIGAPALYRLLQAVDEDVRELFKVKADFAPDMDWDPQHVLDYAAFISRRVREAGLIHFDRGAVGRVVEWGARLRDHRGKLSTRLLDISDLVDEASYWAVTRAHPVVGAEDVDQAVARKRYRSNLIEERVRELIQERVLVVETVAERVGCVNGLSVIDLGDHRFGQPTRISARVSPGPGTLQSVEREINLSGPIHSKGFLILSGYLAGKYAQRWPLALRASITFEQAYDEVDGDSASSTELYALLSALSGIPIHQGIAVTGSIDQRGAVQAVGGVNEKIEGFFAVCEAQGLTGDQGVLIPTANQANLMLSANVVEAVARHDFHVWTVSTVDEGLELLTGVASGERVDGEFAVGTLHRAVEDRLRTYAEALRAFGAPRDGQGSSPSA